jgi:hypothetical protein
VKQDALVGAALAAAVLVYALTAIGLADLPEEDAAMLLRYSRNIAAGHGMVWNIGEPPVDGATDFLFTWAVAAVCASGLTVVQAAKAVGLAAHVATVVLIYLAARRLHGASPPVALLPAVYLAVGPGLRYVAASYGTTLFALTVAGAFWAATRLVAAPAGDVTRAATAFGLLCLIMGLARPEGALLAVFFTGSVLLARGGTDGRTIVLRFALTFGLLGLAYFLWRWWYFGHPLPNPFYRRGGGGLYPESLTRSIRSVWRVGAPFLLVIAAGLFKGRTRRAALFSLVPIVLFTLVWIFFSDEANYYMRYWYPILLVMLLGWLPIARGLLEGHRLPSPRMAAAVMLALAAVAGGVQHWRFSHIRASPIGLYDVALGLSGLQAKGMTLVTTEAGLLPLYSRWRAIDAWGLNDAWIAQNGGVTPEYLDRYRPEVVMFHAYFTPENENQSSETRGLGRAWARMVRTLKKYVEDRGYTLAAVYAKHARESHYYYVRAGFLDHDQVVGIIKRQPYPWGGRAAEDVTPSRALPRQ